MAEIIFILMSPIIFFLAVVAPIWLVLYYRHKGKQRNSFTEVDQRQIETLTKTGNQLEERIRILESILDSEHPDWRQKQ